MNVVEMWECYVDMALTRIRFNQKPIDQLRYCLQDRFDDVKICFSNDDMYFWDKVYDIAKLWYDIAKLQSEGTYQNNSSVERAICDEFVAFFYNIPSYTLFDKRDLDILLALGLNHIAMDEAIQHMSREQRHQENIKLHIEVLLYALEHNPTHDDIPYYIEKLEEDYEMWHLYLENHITSFGVRHLIYAFTYDASWIPLAEAWKQRQAAAQRIQRMVQRWSERRRRVMQRARLSTSTRPAKRPKLRLRF